MSYVRFKVASNSFQNSAREVTQMWSENHFSSRMSGGFRLVTVGKHAIQSQVYFTKTIRDSHLMVRAAYTAGHINYRPLAEIQQFGVNQ